MPRASIDIGSNSLLLRVEADDGKVLADTVEVVGLGRGLGDRGLFRPDRMERAMEVLQTFTETARSLGVPPVKIQAAATSAARRAMNAKSFFDKAKDNLGVTVRVISGDEEARLTFLGAQVGLPTKDDVVVIDLGGGSTEFVMGAHGQLTLRQSLEMGAVRLTEAFLGTDRVSPSDLARMRTFVHENLEQLAWPRLPRGIIAVGGTATTLAAMELGLPEFDPDRVHGLRLDRRALRRWVDRLLPADHQKRVQLCPISPKRADYLLAGAVVLESACEHARRESLVVSTGGLRNGLLM